MTTNSPSEARPSIPHVSPYPASVAPLATDAQATPALALTRARSNGRPRSAEISDIPTVVAAEGVADAFQAELHGLSKPERALKVVDILNDHQQKDELLGISLHYLWNTYVAGENLWEHYEGGEAKFKKDVSYAQFIEPTLIRVNESEAKKAKYTSNLQREWGAGWELIVDPRGNDSSRSSQHYLGYLSTLACGGMVLSDAGYLLNLVIRARIENPRRGVRRQPSVMAGDIRKVVEAVEAVSKSRKIQPKQCDIGHLVTYLSPESMSKRIVARAKHQTTIPLPEIAEEGTLVRPRALSAAAEFLGPEAVLNESGVWQPVSVGLQVLPSVSNSSHTPPQLSPPQPSIRDSTADEIVVWPSSSVVSEVSPCPPSSTPGSEHVPLRHSPTLDSALQETGIRLSPSVVLEVTPSSHHSEPNSPGTLHDGSPTPDSASHETGVPPSLLTQLRASPSSSPAGAARAPPSWSGSSSPTVHSQSGVGPSLSTISVVLHSSPPPTVRAQLFPVESAIVIPGGSELDDALPPSHSSSPMLLSVAHTEFHPPGTCSSLQSTVSSSHTSSPHVPTQCTTDSTRPQCKRAATASQVQPPAKKPRRSQIISAYTEMPPPVSFQLQKEWIGRTAVEHQIYQKGFYVPQFGLRSCPEPMLDEINRYRRAISFAGGTGLDNCYHSMLQQVLVQDPLVYLTALAAMKTTNTRMISIPVAPIIFPSDEKIELMGSDFPFAQFLANEHMVPATRLLYSVGKAEIRIANLAPTKEAVDQWWGECGGNFEEAARPLDLDMFRSCQLGCGEFVVFPPQQPWYVGSASVTSQRSPSADKENILLEVRYISITEENSPNFYESLQELYEEISRSNRDLVCPKITGWGTASQSPLVDKRCPTAIEIRGVWNIGDALLGLQSWSSPLVQMELKRLFCSPEGKLFNEAFVKEVQDKFKEKLKTMMPSLEFLCEWTNHVATP